LHRYRWTNNCQLGAHVVDWSLRVGTVHLPHSKAADPIRWATSDPFTWKYDTTFRWLHSENWARSRFQPSVSSGPVLWWAKLRAALSLSCLSWQSGARDTISPCWLILRITESRTTTIVHLNVHAKGSLQCDGRSLERKLRNERNERTSSAGHYWRVEFVSTECHKIGERTRLELQKNR